MRKSAFIAIGLTALAISAFAPRYYDHGDRYGYYGRGHSDRDRDNDGVPNYEGRRPNNPYRN
ncbi:MAG: hypothetical protein NTX21_05130 [Alphaproteobacteria bacterium]|nr:hypothetical protein [Alphaproteobacteria bacterium]